MWECSGGVGVKDTDHRNSACFSLFSSSNPLLPTISEAKTTAVKNSESMVAYRATASEQPVLCVSVMS